VHIVYVSAYFPPEMGAPAARVSELSRAWVKAGHKVTVLTGFANHPTGVKAPTDRRTLTRRETWEGVNVVRSYVYAAANKGTARRMASYGSFMTSASLIGPARISRPDIVIGTSPHLLTPVAGYTYARLKGAPFVFEVRDLWPESIIAVDAMKEGAMIRGLKKLAKYLYFHSDRVVTVGQGYKRCIHDLYGLPLDRMDVVPNGVDVSHFAPSPRSNEIRSTYGWGDKFVVMYIGTHGMAHGLSTTLDAAKKLASNPNIHFVFVGEGAEKENLKAKSAQMGLQNVQFIDQQPKSKVPLFYAACDIGLVSLRNTPLFQEVLPSKIFEYLGMERPMVISVDGDARRLVEEAGAGLFVPPENADALADAVVKLSQSPENLTKMGQSGRRYVMENYDRNALAQKYLTVLQDIVDRKKKR
jgi:colanic acid biosynthesis glycosyl transferase WcaI